MSRHKSMLAPQESKLKARKAEFMIEISTPLVPRTKKSHAKPLPLVQAKQQQTDLSCVQL